MAQLRLCFVEKLVNIIELKLFMAYVVHIYSLRSLTPSPWTFCCQAAMPSLSFLFMPDGPHCSSQALGSIPVFAVSFPGFTGNNNCPTFFTEFDQNRGVGCFYRSSFFTIQVAHTADLRHFYKLLVLDQLLVSDIEHPLGCSQAATRFWSLHPAPFWSSLPLPMPGRPVPSWELVSQDVF